MLTFDEVDGLNNSNKVRFYGALVAYNHNENGVCRGRKVGCSFSGRVVRNQY